MDHVEAEIRRGLRSVFDAGVAAADPGRVLAAALPPRPQGRCIVVGAGKAAGRMAAALEAAWPDVDLSGVVVTRYGHAVPTAKVQVLEASHPVPDANSVVAAERMLAAVSGLSASDTVIALISGGGSALLTLPLRGMDLADKQAINRALLRCGAPIDEMNTVRKALSRIKGGRLARAAAPARVVTLVISDVPGDDPAVIASGPTVEGGSTVVDALRLLDRYGITLPAPVRRQLEDAAEEPAQPTGLSASGDIRIIASPSLALQACASRARMLGWEPLILGDAIEGESAALGVVMAGIARSVRRHGYPSRPPALLLSGGETTVRIGDAPAGRGGRNTEFLLALANQFKREQGVWAIAGDSDGIDGTEDAAGALVSPDTAARARSAGLDIEAMLRAHDSYSLFHALGDLVLTGPTRTNVNDLRAVLVL